MQCEVSGRCTCIYPAGQQTYERDEQVNSLIRINENQRTKCYVFASNYNSCRSFSSHERLLGYFRRGKKGELFCLIIVYFIPHLAGESPFHYYMLYITQSRPITIPQSHISNRRRVGQTIFLCHFLYICICPNFSSLLSII